jgi:hypothetical protein
LPNFSEALAATFTTGLLSRVKKPMKSLFPISVLVMLLLAVFSCRKEKPTLLNQKVVGQWRWAQSNGGFTGKEVIKPAAGTIVTLTLHQDLTYVASLNNKPVHWGTFDLAVLQSGHTVIRFDTAVQVETLFLPGEESIENVDNTALALFDSQITDGYSHQFQRVE